MNADLNESYARLSILVHIVVSTPDSSTDSLTLQTLIDKFEDGDLDDQSATIAVHSVNSFGSFSPSPSSTTAGNSPLPKWEIDAISQIAGLYGTIRSQALTNSSSGGVATASGSTRSVSSLLSSGTQLVLDLFAAKASSISAIADVWRQNLPTSGSSCSPSSVVHTLCALALLLDFTQFTIRFLSLKGSDANNNDSNNVEEVTASSLAAHQTLYRDVKKDALECYIKHILTAKPSSSTATTTSTIPGASAAASAVASADVLKGLLAHISPYDWGVGPAAGISEVCGLSEPLQDTVLKLVKKAPESSSHAVAALLASLPHPNNTNVNNNRFKMCYQAVRALTESVNRKAKLDAEQVSAGRKTGKNFPSLAKKLLYLLLSHQRALISELPLSAMGMKGGEGGGEVGERGRMILTTGMIGMVGMTMPVGYIDVSTFVEQQGAVSSALRMLKSNDESVRVSGLLFAQQMAARVMYNPTALQIILTQLLDGLSGTSTGANATQKCAVLNAIDICLCTCDMLNVGKNECVEICADLLAQKLCAVIDKQTEESDVKALAGRVLGRGLALCMNTRNNNNSSASHDKSSSALRVECDLMIKLLDKQTAAKNIAMDITAGALLPHLYALNLALNRHPHDGAAKLSEIGGNFEIFVRSLCGFLSAVTAGSASVNNSSSPCLEPIFALKIALSLISVSSVANSAFESAKLWASAVKNKDSFLYARALCGLLSPSSSTGLSDVQNKRNACFSVCDSRMFGQESRTKSANSISVDGKTGRFGAMVVPASVQRAQILYQGLLTQSTNADNLPSSNSAPTPEKCAIHEEICVALSDIFQICAVEKPELFIGELCDTATGNGQQTAAGMLKKSSSGVVAAKVAPVPGQKGVKLVKSTPNTGKMAAPSVEEAQSCGDVPESSEISTKMPENGIIASLRSPTSEGVSQYASSPALQILLCGLFHPNYVTVGRRVAVSVRKIAQQLAQTQRDSFSKGALVSGNGPIFEILMLRMLQGLWNSVLAFGEKQEAQNMAELQGIQQKISKSAGSFTTATKIQSETSEKPTFSGEVPPTSHLAFALLEVLSNVTKNYDAACAGHSDSSSFVQNVTLFALMLSSHPLIIDTPISRDKLTLYSHKYPGLGHGKLVNPGDFSKKVCYKMWERVYKFYISPLFTVSSSFTIQDTKNSKFLKSVVQVVCACGVDGRTMHTHLASKIALHSLLSLPQLASPTLLLDETITHLTSTAICAPENNNNNNCDEGSILQNPAVFFLSARQIDEILDPNTAIGQTVAELRRAAEGESGEKGALLLDSAAALVDQMKITNQDRKKAGARSARKGAGAFGGAADAGLLEDAEDWALRLKQEKAAKLIAAQKQQQQEQTATTAGAASLSSSIGTGGGIVDIAVERVSQSLSETLPTVQRYTRALTLLQDLVASPPISETGDSYVAAVRKAVPGLLRDTLLPLMKSPVLRDAVVVCLQSLAAFSLEQDLQFLARDIALSLRLVVEVESAQDESPTPSALGENNNSSSNNNPETSKTSSLSVLQKSKIPGLFIGNGNPQARFFEYAARGEPLLRVFRSMQPVVMRSSPVVRGLAGSSSAHNKQQHNHLHQQQQHGVAAKSGHSSGSSGLEEPHTGVVLPSTLSFVFPVFEAVLRLRAVLPGTDTVFLLLDYLWPHAEALLLQLESTDNSDRVLQKSMIEISLNVLAHLKVEPSPEKVLTRVCTQLLPENPIFQEEWMPILGEAGLLNKETKVRIVCAHILLKMAGKGANPIGKFVPSLSESLSNPSDLGKDSTEKSQEFLSFLEARLWMLRFDEVESVRQLAHTFWTHTTEDKPDTTTTTTIATTFPTSPLSWQYYRHLSPLLEYKSDGNSTKTPSNLGSTNDEMWKLHAKSVRFSAAKAIAAACTDSFSVNGVQVLREVQALYVNSLPHSPALPAKTATTIGGSGVLSKAEGKAQPQLKAIGKGKAAAGGKELLSAAAILAPSGVRRGNNISGTPEDKTSDLRLAIAQIFHTFGSNNTATSGGSSLSVQDVQSTQIITEILQFLLDYGVVDMDSEVRGLMLAAGRVLIENYGLQFLGDVIAQLEAVLAREAPNSARSSAEELAVFDHRYSAAVVLMGAAGRHLDREDGSVLTIIDSLIQALKTPSESVQRAVADCLVPLVQTCLKGTDKAKELLEQLLVFCLDGETYGERRGAAFGLSAAVKGVGITCLKQLEIVNRLKDACAVGSVNNRQGALFALECFSDRLGLLFEPYIMSIVPALIKSFSHSSDHVREAAQGAARVIMAKLSAHGVKQVLQPILASLPGESQWKSRQEAIRLLGMMAHCAPRQLATSLPQIVPVLVDAGSDPHPKVKESAKNALQDISSVIRNPEVARLSPVLLSAMADPARNTKPALEALLQCEFMHAIDAPSLALLVPILSRALKDRGADLKRKSAAITGNIMSMVSEAKTLHPYLGALLPGLKDCLVDPIPDVRATSSKALGRLVSEAGVEEIEEMRELLPWLSKTLTTENSPVERSGAAQGLAEVCASLGEEKVEQVFYDVLLLQHTTATNSGVSVAKSAGLGGASAGTGTGVRTTTSSAAAAREGLLWYLSFLPAALHEEFARFLDDSLPVVIAGLADENESVREVALRAGQVIVMQMGLNHTLEILPSLTEGMFDDDWRIRASSLKLLGELLFLVGDTGFSASTGAGGFAADEDEEDEGEDEEEEAEEGGDFVGKRTKISYDSRVASRIRTHIGDDNFQQVLSSLYIVRSDLNMTVRQSALQIWKAVISQTPRTLVEIMPVLVNQLIDMLSSDSEDIRMVGGRALGEAVRKLGDKVLPAVVPYLKDGLASEDESMRQGVCAGLAEILSACSRKQAEEYVDALIPALQLALCDKSLTVCNQAAKAFLTLFKIVGTQAIDEVVPALLQTLSHGAENAELALRGLRSIVQQRPRDLLDYLLPKLLQSPVQVDAARALGAVVEVAGAQLMYYFATLVPALVSELKKLSKLLEEGENINSSKHNNKNDGNKTIGSSGAELGEEEQKNLKERLDAVKEAASATMSVVTTSGLHHFISEIGKQTEHETSVPNQRWGVWLTGQFVSRAKNAEFEEYIPLLLKQVLAHVADLDIYLLEAVRDTLTAISKHVSMAVLIGNIDFMRNCINSAASTARHRAGTGAKLVSAETGQFVLPLFTLPKSLDPLLAVYLHALMNAYPELREAAAVGIGEMVQMSDLSVLKPVLIKTTGPLIRVVGERFPSSVKSAILQTLCVLLDKGGVSLKAFVPQLQTTFIKSLSDPSREVRQRGSAALGKLMSLSVKIDPLLNDLAALVQPQQGGGGDGSGGSTSSSNAIKTSVLDAIYSVLHSNCIAAVAKKAKIRDAERAKAAVLGGQEDGEREEEEKGVGALMSTTNAQKFSQIPPQFVAIPAEKIVVSVPSPAALSRVRDVLLGSNITDEDDHIRYSTARCLSVLGAYFSISQTSAEDDTETSMIKSATDILFELMEDYSVGGTSGSWSRASGLLAGIGAILHSTAHKINASGPSGARMYSDALQILVSGLKDARPTVKTTACSAVGTLLTVPETLDREELLSQGSEYRTALQLAVHTLSQPLALAAADSSSGEVRTAAILAIKQSAKSFYGASAQHLREFLPPLITAYKEINIRVKYVAERALKHLAEGGQSSSTTGGFSAPFQTYLASADPETAKFVREYHRKFVAKMSLDSDDEA